MKVICVSLLLLILVGEGSTIELSDKAIQSEMRDMVLIEGGSFQMGDLFKEGTPIETPVHEVKLSAFYLNKYEVTVEEFKAFAADTLYMTLAESMTTSEGDCKVKGEPKTVEEYNARLSSCGALVIKSPSEMAWSDDACWRKTHFEQGRNDPVTCISWKDAVSYCNWLSSKEGLPAAYDIETGDILDSKGQPTKDVTQVKGYRLPTEAEWEYAARERGKKVRFGNGKDTARSSEMNFNASDKQYSYSKKGEFRKKTVPVDTFKPNSLGLYDMSGNVWEWCSDYLCWYESDPQTDPYQVEPLIMGPRHAARCGPWSGDACKSRAAARYGWVAEDRCNNIGFRIARSK